MGTERKQTLVLNERRKKQTLVSMEEKKKQTKQKT